MRVVVRVSKFSMGAGYSEFRASANEMRNLMPSDQWDKEILRYAWKTAPAQDDAEKGARFTGKAP